MNTFANTLFSAMLGWVRDIIAGLFRMVSSGSAGSFLRWTANNWLPLVTAIIIVGILLDLLIWIIRWRPHYVWLSTIRSLRSQKRRKHNSVNKREFETGYSNGMGYDFFRAEDEFTRPSEPETEPAAYSITPPHQAPGLYIMPDQEYSYGIQADEQSTADGKFLYYPIQDESGNVQGEAITGHGGLPVRRKRSNQHKPRLFGAIGKVGKRLLSATAGEQPIDSLPPPIAKRDAFYEPVYPSREPLHSGRQATNAMPVFGQPKNTSGRDGADSK